MDKLTLGALIFMCCVWALRELYSMKDRRLEKNTEATLQNTMALLEHKVELAHLKATMQSLPKMQSDINEAHAKLREMRAAIKMRNQ